MASLYIHYVNNRPCYTRNYGGISIVVSNLYDEDQGLRFTVGNGEALYTTFKMRREKYNEGNGYVHYESVKCRSLKALKRHIRKYCQNLRNISIIWDNINPAYDRIIKVYDAAIHMSLL